MLPTINKKRRLASNCSLILLSMGLICGFQAGARADFTLILDGPATATAGLTETITGTISGAPDDLSDSIVFLSIDTYPPAFSDPSDFNVVGPPYDYSSSIVGGSYTGNLFDLSIDPSTPPGIYDLSFTIFDLDSLASATPELDLQQTVEEGVQGPGAVPEPSTPLSMMVMCVMVLFYIVRARLRSRRAPAS